MSPFRHFFYFPKSDRRILLMLALLTVFCVGVVIIVETTHPQQNHRTQQALPREGSGYPDRFATQKDKGIYSPPLGGNGGGISPHPFDPNTIDSASLVSFGLAPWKVRNFIHYRAAGKKFYSAEDMLQTYGWKQEDVEPLRKYIKTHAKPLQEREESGHSDRLATQKEKGKYAPPDGGVEGGSTSSKFTSLTLLDLNTADTTLLKKVPGIGSYYAASIVRLRQRLGGFTSVEQLFEINRFPAETLEWFEIQTHDIQQIDINTASFKQLAAHPYFGYEATKRLQRYIRLYGPIADTNQLRSTGIFTDEQLERLSPYLKFQ